MTTRRKIRFDTIRNLAEPYGSAPVHRLHFGRFAVGFCASLKGPWLCGSETFLLWYNEDRMFFLRILWFMGGFTK